MYLCHIVLQIRRMESAIHWINHNPMVNSIFFCVYSPDIDLSGGMRYPPFGQPTPVLFTLVFPQNLPNQSEDAHNYLLPKLYEI